MIVCTVSCSTPALRPSTQCGPSATMIQGKCKVPTPEPLYLIPFPLGRTTVINQGYYGAASHMDHEPFAIDFACEIGDPIIASRSGVVLETKLNGRYSCFEEHCKKEANYITIDHGDGTYATYSHLSYGGTKLRRGDQICAGEVIALCGSTGYSTGPHLHFVVTDAARRSLPVQFLDITPRTFFSPGESIRRTESARKIHCSKTQKYSKLGRHAFAHQGILLSEPLDINQQYEDKKAHIKLRGKFVDPSLRKLRQEELMGQRWVRKRGEDRFRWNRIAINLAYVNDSLNHEYTPVWHRTCVPLNLRGDFSGDVSLLPQSEGKTPTRLWLMLTAAYEDQETGECFSDGWGWAYKIFIDHP